MANEYIIGSSSQDTLPPEITPEDIVRLMQSKALAFDVLMYVLCVDGKTGELKIPKNKSKYTTKEYNFLFNNIFKKLSEIDDIATFKIFKNNMSKYIDGVLLGKK